MPVTFWIRRYLTVLLVAFALIAIAQYLRGNDLQGALVHAAFWAWVSATVFTVGRYLQARRGLHCAVCRDTPELQQDKLEQRD